MKDLNNLRTQIDQIDEKILDLIKKRFNLAIEIGKHKKENGLSIKDPDREKEIMSNKTGIYKKIWELLLKESKRLQE